MLRNRGLRITTLLVAIAALPAFVMSVVLMVTNYLTRIEEVRSDLQDRGRIIAAALAEASRYGVVSGNRAALEDPAANLLKSDLSVAAVEIRDGDGQVLLNRSTRDIAAPESQAFRHPIRSQVLSVDLFEGAEAQRMSGRRHAATGPRMDTGPQIGEVLVYMSPEPLLAAKREAIRLSSIFIIGSAVISWLLGIGLAQVVRGPLGEVMAALRRIQGGDFAVGPPRRTRGELGELQQAIADMAVELGAGREQLETKVRQRTAELQEAVQQAEAAHAEKRRLIARGNDQIEDERRRIALELHDHTGGTLIAGRMIALNVQAMADDLGPQATDVAKSAGELAALIDTLYTGTRNIVKQLRPEMIDTLGLRGALAELVQTYAGNSVHCRFALHVDEPFPDLRGQPAMVAYRLVQEALTNTIKHAQASEVRVALSARADGGGLRIEICDNGIGFAAEPSDPKTGLGLVGMRERVDSVGGSMEILSEPGRGTQIVLHLPLADGSAV